MKAHHYALIAGGLALGYILWQRSRGIYTVNGVTMSRTDTSGAAYGQGGQGYFNQVQGPDGPTTGAEGAPGAGPGNIDDGGGSGDGYVDQGPPNPNMYG